MSQISLCLAGIMSLCGGLEEKGVDRDKCKDCLYYEKGSNGSYMFLRFNEYCDCLEAQLELA